MLCESDVDPGPVPIPYNLYPSLHLQNATACGFSPERGLTSFGSRLMASAKLRAKFMRYSSVASTPRRSSLLLSSRCPATREIRRPWSRMWCVHVAQERGTYECATRCPRIGMVADEESLAAMQYATGGGHATYVRRYELGPM